jgi:hypothetical protein
VPNPDVLVLSDFVREETTATKGRAVFAVLYHVNHVGEIIDELVAMLLMAKAEGKSAADLVATSRMTFTGPPGTGKHSSRAHQVSHGHVIHRQDCYCKKIWSPIQGTWSWWM